MRTHLNTLFLTFSAALLLVTACVEDGPGQTSCERDSDCSDNQTCVENTCTDASCLCPAVWKPVCGMDGTTYGNACEAECRGVSIGHDGSCTSGCYADEECGEGQHCTASEECLPPPGCEPDSDCSSVCYGRCVSDTCDCTDISAPVCGTDGLTYENACSARCAGVGVASSSACSACQELACDLDCPAGFKTDSNGCPVCQCLEPTPFCHDDGSCAQDGYLCDRSSCVPSCPECTDCNFICVDPATCACPEPRHPVCGVDNVTYDSLCLATCVGVEKAYRGPCLSSCEDISSCELDCAWGFATNDDGCATCVCREEPLLCKSNADCPESLQCDPAACVPSCPTCDDCNPACTTALSPITCANACSLAYDPVCGVDGTVYDNACLAGCNNITIDATKDACASVSTCRCDDRIAPVCGANNVTFQNACEALCAGAEILSYSACDCPTSCLVPDPVCGTNNVTYTCGAEQAACNGVDVRWRGSCEEPRLCSSDLDCAEGQRCDTLACAPSCPTCDDCNPACL